jgi:hypothetical protein
MSANPFSGKPLGLENQYEKSNQQNHNASQPGIDQGNNRHLQNAY